MHTLKKTQKADHKGWGVGAGEGVNPYDQPDRKNTVFID